MAASPSRGCDQVPAPGERAPWDGEEEGSRQALGSPPTEDREDLPSLLPRRLVLHHFVHARLPSASRLPAPHPSWGEPL